MRHPFSGRFLASGQEMTEITVFSVTSAENQGDSGLIPAENRHGGAAGAACCGFSDSYRQTPGF